MTRKRIQRNTPQRRVILEELTKIESHPTAAMLYETVRRRLPRISLGTVYRNLDLLADAGIIRKLELVGSEARFDATVERHEHVRCVECGRVDDLRGVAMEEPDLTAGVFGGYQVVGYRIEFLGICPECAKAPQKPHTNAGEENHAKTQDAGSAEQAG